MGGRGVVVHVYVKIVDCSKLSKLLLQTDYLYDILLTLKTPLILLLRFVGILISLTLHMLPFMLFLLLVRKVRLFLTATEQRMPFRSPLVGNDLVEIPCQYEIHHNIDDKTDNSHAYSVFVNLGCEVRSNLVGLAIGQSPKCQ